MKNSLSQLAVDSLVSKLLPKYGTKGVNIPIYDKDKHMYLVDQHPFPSGNRRLTYVALSDNIIAEVTYGHFHTWEYMDKLRVMTPDGNGFKIIKSMDWPKCTRMDMSVINVSIQDALVTYISSAPGADRIPEGQITEVAKKMTDNLMSNTMDYLDSPIGKKILTSYCETFNLCKDYCSINTLALVG